jgi:WD40 repeat protein
MMTDISINQKIDYLLDAIQFREDGLDIIIRALNDPIREIRQSALLLLSESDVVIARESIWNHLPYKNMQCLHTITEFKFGHPDYFKIADYNTLLCYFDTTYRSSHISIWNLETGIQKTEFPLSAHEFGIGEYGKMCIFNYQEHLTLLDIETQQERFLSFGGFIPSGQCLAVSPTSYPLFAIGNSHHSGSNIEIWNYRTLTCILKIGHQKLYFNHINKYLNSQAEVYRHSVPLILFTPDGKYLVFLFRQGKCSVIQIWDVEKLEIVQTIDNLPLLTLNALAVNPNKEILACGVREDKIQVWELSTDRIIDCFTNAYLCTISSDGRVIAYCTNDYEIIIWDVHIKKELCILRGHSSPIAHITMSLDREFIASYSIDGTIRIWGVAES